MAATNLSPARQTGDRPETTTDTGFAVRIDKVSKRFDRRTDTPPVLDEMSLDVAPGEFVALLGASGCGKSTLLNLVAGLEPVTSGRIEVPGGPAALMFQEPAPVAMSSWHFGCAGCREPTGGPKPSGCSSWCGSASRTRPGSMSCPVACGNGSRWPARWPRTRRCC
jgi:hypothetical protein